MDISRAQQLVNMNKVTKGFNTSDVPLEFAFIIGEVGEAFKAWRYKNADLGEELADIGLFLMGLATMTGVDLNREIERKLAKNAQRVYEQDERGVPVRKSG